MSNRAWMPLHIENYLADTGHLTAAEHGAYMLLIMSYWRDGGLPADERLIQRMSRLSKDEWAESRDIIAALFQDGWRHKRIDEELAKADEIIEKRRNAALGRHAKIKADASAEQVHSKSSDTGVPPRTDNQLSSSQSSEDNPPPNPLRGENGDLINRILEGFPQSPHSKPDVAERWLLKQSLATLRDIAAATDAYSRWFWPSQASKGRTGAEAAGYAPGIHKWLADGSWKSVGEIANVQAVEPMVKLDRERDAELWVACEQEQGKKAPTSGLSWSFRQSVVDRAKASLMAGAA